MSLTTKPRTGAVHKQIHAAHHRQSKHYLKTYWPYLPVLVIVVGGLYLASNWHTTNVPSPGPKLTNYTYYDVLESSIGLLALSIFLLRHAFAWRKVFVKSETFAIKHPMFDIALVSIAVVGLLLSHHNVPA